MKLINHIQTVIRNFREDLRKYRELKKTTPKDCHGQLLSELLLKPGDLANRYEEEIEFRQRLDDRWKR